MKKACTSDTKVKSFNLLGLILEFSMYRISWYRIITWAVGSSSTLEVKIKSAVNCSINLMLCLVLVPSNYSYFSVYT